MAKPQNFAGFTLYRIYYGEHIVYLGRTMQPLQNRIRGHLFKKPMHREICIEQVSKIEYATFKSQADMYLYEIYFINLWRPALNKDDKASDSLTVSLPDVEWKLFTTPLWEKWRKEIEDNDISERNQRKAELEAFEKQRGLRKQLRNGEITEDEYWSLLEEVKSNGIN